MKLLRQFRIPAMLALLAFSAQISVGGSEVVCPDNFFQVRDHCFFVEAKKFDWAYALVNCEARGSLLAHSLNDCNVLGGLMDYFDAYIDPTSSVWVGGSDLQEEGIYLWVTGEPVNMGKLYWARNQPNGGVGVAQNCMFIAGWDNYGFYDTGCANEYYSLCEAAPIQKL